jgi:FkbM family methyltransferase
MKLFLKALRKLGLLDKINFSLCNDEGIQIPIIKSIGYQHFFEKETWLKSLLSFLLGEKLSKGCFVDVGVNIGQTLLKVKYHKPDIQYFGFEPNPICIFYLNELCRINTFKSNTVVFPFAIGSESGITDLTLFNNDQADSSASIVSGFRKDSLEKIKVPVINGYQLTLLFKDFVVGIIKIDVEGGELEVLKAFENIVKRDRPLIVCEILPVYKEENTFRVERQNEVQSFLRYARYGIGRISATMEITVIKEIDIHGNMDHVNYIFFPEERKNELLESLKSGVK